MEQDSEILQKKLSLMGKLFMLDFLESMDVFFSGTFANLLLNN